MVLSWQSAKRPKKTLRKGVNDMRFRIKPRQKYFSICFVPVGDGFDYIGLLEKIVPAESKEDAYLYATEFLEKEFTTCTIDFEIIINEVQ